MSKTYRRRTFQLLNMPVRLSFLWCWAYARQVISVLLFCALSGLPSAGWSAITDTGDVQTNGNDLNIANSMDGRRDVTATVDSHDNTSLGNAPNITGTLNVAWENGNPVCAQFNNAAELTVGNLGKAYLNISGFASCRGCYDPIPGSCHTATLVSNRVIAGKNPGSNGYISGYGDHSLEVSGVGNAIVVGDAGAGTLSSLRFVTQTLRIANQPLSTGSASGVSGTVSGADYGGYLGIGISGNGSLGSSGVTVAGPGSEPTAEIGVNVGAKGSAGGGAGALSLTVSGQNARLRVGKYGNGTLFISSGYDYTYGYPGYPYSSVVTVSDIATSDAQVFVAQYPGSTGKVTMNGESTFDAGNVLRIGLDENDNNGGTGLLELTSPGPLVKAGVIKIGLAGIFRENFDFVTFRKAEVIGAIVNRGHVFLSTISPQGNVTNSGEFSITSPFGDAAPGTINGNFLQDSAGVLNRVVNVYDPNAPQTLTVTGTAQVDGTFALQGNYSSVTSDATIRVFEATGGATFAPTLVVTFPNMPAGWTATPMFDATGMSVKFVYSPPSDDLVITAFTGTPDPVLQGQTVTYNISVTNNGPSPATGVTVTGTLPTCTIGNLAAGATANCPATSVTATSTGTLTQTMTVSGTETDTNLANNSKTVNTAVQPVADLSIGLTGTPSFVYQGQTVSYTLSVTNNGPSTATWIVVSGSLPNCLGTTTLAPGATASCTQNVTATTTGLLVQTEFVSGIESDPNLANNSASTSTTVLAAADLSATISAPTSVYVGQTITYNVTVTNNGPNTATGFSLSGLSGCTLGSNTLASGASTSCIASIVASNPGSIATQVVVLRGPGEYDPNLANNFAGISTVVLAAADLSVSLSAPASVLQGQTVTYNVTVTNSGPSSATGIALSGLSGCILGSSTLASGASASCTTSVTTTTTGTLTQLVSVNANEWTAPLELEIRSA